MANETLRPELFRAAQAFLIDYLNYKGSEQLVITGDTAGDKAVIEALSAAAIAAGGRPLTIIIPQLPYQGKLADPYLQPALGAAVNNADVWVDVTFPYIAGSDLHAACMKQDRTRYMLASDITPMPCCGCSALAAWMTISRCRMRWIANWRQAWARPCASPAPWAPM